MRWTWDEEKAAANLAKHGVAFQDARRLDMGTARVIPDRRRHYGEVRFRAVGFIGDRLHVMVFTPRGDGVRVISLRKANRREERAHDADARSPLRRPRRREPRGDRRGVRARHAVGRVLGTARPGAERHRRRTPQTGGPAGRRGADPPRPARHRRRMTGRHTAVSETALPRARPQGGHTC
ncbi:BrnT family toxin [Rhodobacteraceae bacterium CCMM004]|nr:BrnT family toxin [Rhodobacteraceae bacterium CCMM004]